MAVGALAAVPSALASATAASASLTSSASSALAAGREVEDDYTLPAAMVEMLANFLVNASHPYLCLFIVLFYCF